MKPLVLFLLFLIPPFALPAQDPPPLQANLISELASFVPGQAFTVALKLEHAEGWHTYWKNPGDAGLPTTLAFRLPEGVKASPLLWPQPRTYEDPGHLKIFGYEGEALLMSEIRVPAGFAAKTLELRAKATWLSCRELCIPGKADLSLSI